MWLEYKEAGRDDLPYSLAIRGGFPQRLPNAGCLLFGSDRASLKGRHWDTVQLLSIMRRAWNIPSRSAKFHHCLLQTSISHFLIALCWCLPGEKNTAHETSDKSRTPLLLISQSASASVRTGRFQTHQIPHLTSTTGYGDVLSDNIPQPCN